MRIGEATNVQELIAAADAARQDRLNKRRGYETVWWNNIALITGDHYASWNPVTSKFEDRDSNFETSARDRNKKPRLVINHALTVARTELSKLTKSRPIMEIVANSDEQVDVAATKVGKSALDYAEWKFKLDRLKKQALWWMIQTGIGAIYVGWDPLDDKPGFMEYVIDPNTNEPTFNPERKRELEDMAQRGLIEMPSAERHALGELCYKVYSPFQLFPETTAGSFSELREIITDDVINIDVVKGLYGRAARDLTPSSNLALGVMEARMSGRAGLVGGTGSTPAPVEDGVAVHTLWIEPGLYRANKFLRDGVMLRWAAGRTELDFSKRFTYQDGRLPFAFFEHIETSATIWPDCVTTHIRGPNLEIDKTVSQLIENKDYMSNPMWRVATQHKIKTAVKNVAGGMVRYRHVPNVPPPEPIPGIQMPNQVENIVVSLRDQIMDISGQSEVARGRVPSGVRSGVAVAYLQEEDDTKIAPTTNNVEDAIARMSSLTLERFAQYYSVQRTLRYYRRDGIFDVLKFKGADLKNNTDVVAQAGSALPKSKAARQQFTLELLGMGIQMDPDKIEERLELGQAEPDDRHKAIAQANRENNMMLHGVFKSQVSDRPEDEDSVERLTAAVPVKAWHNHEVHIQRHTSVMMDEEFDRLQIEKPDVAALFDEHLNMHYEELRKQQQQQMEMLAAQKGAPDGPPTPAGGAEGTFKSTTQLPNGASGGAVRTTAQQIRPQ